MPTLTGELASLGYVHRESEFFYLNGRLLTGTCGPDALASAASYARQSLVTVQQVYDLMAQRSLCASDGTSNIGQLQQAAGLLGLPVAEMRDYGEPWTGYDTFLGYHLSVGHVNVTELANGQALHDEITGANENAVNLAYHFILLVARHVGGMSQYAGRDLPAGYWACDGDNYAGGNDRTTGFNATDQLQFYSDSTLLTARPCAALAIARLANQSGGTVAAGQPTGFYDLETTDDPQVWLCTSSNHHLGHGFKDFYSSVKGNEGQCGTQLFGLPISEEYGLPDGSTAQDFERARMRFDPKGAAPWAIFCDNLDVQLASVNVTVTKLQGQVNAAAQSLADAGTQLKAAQAASDALTSQNQALINQHNGDEQALSVAQQQVAADSGIITGLQGQVAALKEQLAAAPAQPAPSPAPLADAVAALVKALSTPDGVQLASAYAAVAEAVSTAVAAQQKAAA